MKKFNKMFIVLLVVIAGTFVLANILINTDEKVSGRPYRVEI